MLRTRLTRRGDRRKGHSRKAASVVSLVLLATAASGQTYAVSTFAGIWLPENLSGRFRQPGTKSGRCRGRGGQCLPVTAPVRGSHATRRHNRNADARRRQCN